MLLISNALFLRQQQCYGSAGDIARRSMWKVSSKSPICIANIFACLICFAPVTLQELQIQVDKLKVGERTVTAVLRRRKKRKAVSKGAMFEAGTKVVVLL